MRYIIIVSLSLASLSALWLLASFILARLRGREIERWLREREGQEFPPNGRRVLAVKWTEDL